MWFTKSNETHSVPTHPYFKNNASTTYVLLKYGVAPSKKVVQRFRDNFFFNKMFSEGRKREGGYIP